MLRDPHRAARHTFAQNISHWRRSPQVLPGSASLNPPSSNRQHAALFTLSWSIESCRSSHHDHSRLLEIVKEQAVVSLCAVWPHRNFFRDLHYLHAILDVRRSKRLKTLSTCSHRSEVARGSLLPRLLKFLHSRPWQRKACFLREDRDRRNGYGLRRPR